MTASSSQPLSYLVLEDGTVFPGRSVAARGVAFGEAVFTTAMTGYQEIVTDPSFAEQIICFTAPMVGNYGVAPERSESERVHARGVIMRQATGSEWREWLAGQGVVAIDGVDTRALVLALRERGAMRAAVVGESGDTPDAVLARVLSQAPMAGLALVEGVSPSQPYTLRLHPAEARLHVALIDYGCKRSILRRLSRGGASLTVLPHDSSAEQVLATAADGVLLSNGPGDPAVLQQEVATVRGLIGRVPIFGVCLGHQLLAQAAGYETFKLPFGHRGANHPVLERSTHTVLVTCQNHGFAVRGEGPEVSHVSLYDGTVEGLSFPHDRARSVQFHPEAGPGPHDAWMLIDEWLEELAGASAR